MPFITIGGKQISVTSIDHQLYVTYKNTGDAIYKNAMHPALQKSIELDEAKTAGEEMPHDVKPQVETKSGKNYEFTKAERRLKRGKAKGKSVADEVND